MTQGQWLVFTGPVREGFSEAAHKIGGRFNVANRLWRFDVRDEEAVLALCERFYGKGELQ